MTRRRAKAPESIGQRIIRLSLDVSRLKTPQAIRPREKRIEALWAEYDALTSAQQAGEVFVAGNALAPYERAKRLNDVSLSADYEIARGVLLQLVDRKKAAVAS